MSSWLSAVATKVLHHTQELKDSSHLLFPTKPTTSPKLAAASWIHGTGSSAFADPYHHLCDASTFVLWGFQWV